MPLDSQTKIPVLSSLPDKKNNRILVALSGGIDSIVLTHILLSLGYDIEVAHCNFQLRAKQSDLDEAFVKEFAQAQNIKCHLKKINTQQLSEHKKQTVQIIARDERYHWFCDLLETHRFDNIATAHHLDDSLETFLININRGTGLKGLLGIPAVNNKIIRPLIQWSKSDILKYASEHQLTWREDQSNQQNKYLRNNIRNKVIPHLKEINPSFILNFSKTIRHLQQSQEIINSQLNQIKDKIFISYQDGWQIDIDLLRQYTLQEYYLFELFSPYGFGHVIADLIQLITKAQTGKQLWSDTHRIIRNRTQLLLLPIPKENEVSKPYFIEKKTTKIKQPLKIKMNISEENYNLEQATKKTKIFVDNQMIKYPLRLQKWVSGDGTDFYPKGMKGKKKVSKYFKDQKYAADQKENQWMLYDAHKNLIWIVGERQDRRFVCNENTTSILQISLCLD